MKLTTTRLLAVPALALAGFMTACVPDTPAPTTTTPTTAPEPAKHVMSVGHADVFDVDLHGDHFHVDIKDDSGATPVIRHPEETILQVLPGAKTAVPSAPQFAFLGASGSDIWILPQSQNPDLLWPGSSTERIAAGELKGNKVEWTVKSISGPGEAFVFQVGSFGSVIRWFGTDQAFPQTKDLHVPSHVHYNWAFSAEGTYTMVMEAEGELPDGTHVHSGDVTYTWKVGAV